MAKVKNKRNAGLADRVNKKKSEGVKKKINPFEVHVNREKIKVLGKKSKHDRGLPGVARAKAIQKRKETLGTELKLMNKTNAFIDRRIGEKDTNISAEDRMVARFAAERVKQHSKKSVYNLADDEILTHRGQTLEQIEKFDDPRSSDDEDEEAKRFGGLNDRFVSEGHFGGGILSKTDSKDGAKSHKDLIEQLIAESKKRKAEKQKEKEQTLDLTEKLDSEWKDLQPVVLKKAKIDQQESLIDKLLSQAEKKNEDYDKTMRELRFEKRGTPSDGLKSDEKQAKEEKEKIEKLEREREQRMMDDDEAKMPKVQHTTNKHRSADDLDDNFELEDEKEFMLAYDKDGNPLVPEHILNDYSVPNSKQKFEDGISDSSSDDGEDDDDVEESKNQSKDQRDEQQDSSDENSDKELQTDFTEKDDTTNQKQRNDLKNPLKQMKKQPLRIRNNEDSIETKEDSSELDIKSNKLNGSNDADNQTSEDDESNSEDDGSSDEDDHESDEDVEIKKKDDFNDLKESESEEEIVDGDEERISSFFDSNMEGDNLNELLKDKTPTEQSTAIKKLIKSYDPSLSEGNKDLLSRLYARMLQYINDIFTNVKEEGDLLKAFLIFDKLAPYFYDLAHTNKVSSKKFMCELLKEKHNLFQRNPKKVPDLDTLILFKLISLIYPTSDFKHPVTTPSLLFMMEILRLGRFNDAYSVSRGIFVTTLILEYTSLSKRYVPEAINFLRGILYLTANTCVLNPVQVIPPFKLHRDIKILNLQDDCSKMAFEKKMTAKDLVPKEIDNSIKIRWFLSSVLMLKEFFDNCNEIEAQECIFETHLKLLGRVDLELYPKKVTKIVSGVIKHMKESLEVKTYTPLCRERKKPKALRLYEPDIQDVFTGSKSSKLSREEAERRRYQHKYKKEMKGALREIRRDKAYVASVKIRQKIHSDNMRKEKVKQIYKEGALQQGELNKIKRMK